MKTNLFRTLLFAVVAAIGSAAVPMTAEAGGSHRKYSHKCGKCGGSVYKKRVIVRRDRCGKPVHRWKPISHRCSSHSSRGHRGHGHGNNKPCGGYRGHSGTEHLISGILHFIAERSR